MLYIGQNLRLSRLPGAKLPIQRVMHPSVITVKATFAPNAVYYYFVLPFL